jgi:hypothetical protein
LKFDEVGKADTSVNLIKDIEASNQNVKEFLSNPFLCSLLYRSYSFSKDIPSKKVTFYNEVYTALFKSHDLSKDAYKRPKHSNLDEHDFRLVLREFAILTVKQGEVDYDYPTLLSYLTLSKENLKNIQFEEAKFVADLLGTVPLFVKDGNRIKWAHKSLQDYFAAEYISFNSQKEQILTRIYNTQNLKYLNIIDLIFELDYKSSRKTIIYLTIKDYQNYFDGSFTKFKDFPIDLINHRKYLTYGLTIWLQKVDSFGGDTFTAIRKNIFKEFPEYKNIPLNATISAGLFCIAYNYSFKRNILDLLIYKGLIESFDIKNPPERFKLKEYIFFPQKPTLLDDSVNSVFNKKTRFEKINRFICNFVRNKYQYHRFRYKLVDISVCNQLINQIEDELKRDETIDVFGGY